MSKDKADYDVLPVLDLRDMVWTSRIIPIPIFFVPLFMNKAKPKHPGSRNVPTLYYVYFEKTLPTLKERTQPRYDFLLAETGYDKLYNGEEPPFSQLALHMANLRLDSVLFKWGDK